MAIDVTNNGVEITGLGEFETKLQKLKTDNPGFEKRLQGAIRKVLGEVRVKMQSSAQTDLGMNADPRKAYKAVRYAVYKRILGGQVNILDPRKVQKMPYNPPRKLQPKQRGGNRMTRSDRTQDLLDDFGAARAFVLRFLNAGTEPRYNGGRNGRTQEQRDKFFLNHGGRAFRGAISGRNWFGPRSHAEMQKAAYHIQEIIDKVINDEFV